MDLATVNKLLTTTRSVRARLDLTRPVPPELIEECLEIAVQAPQGSNLCRYQFIVVTDPTKRNALAELYRKSFAEFYPPERIAERRKAQPRDVMSWTSLAEHSQNIPVLIIACVEGRPEGLLPERLAGLYGNILPITWSLMLALRARGVGAAWTTIVFKYEKEVDRTPADSRKHDASGIATGRVLQGRRFQAGAARPGARAYSLEHMGEPAIERLGGRWRNHVKHTSINFLEKFGLFSEQWQPKVIAEMNDYQFKVVKLQGDFIWHDHKDTDETFIVVEGDLRIDLRDGAVHVSTGEMFVVPKGVEHKPYAEHEVKLLLIEPRGVLNTGHEGGDRTAMNDIWI